MTRGFTLVETLVALFVFGLIAAAGVIILGNSADAQLRIGEASRSVQDMQRLRAALRADLGQMAVRVTREATGARPARRARRCRRSATATSATGSNDWRHRMPMAPRTPNRRCC